jgi:hypothetical protein
VRLEHRGDPGRPETADRFAGLVAKHKRVLWLLAAVGIELQPFEHRSQPRCRDGHEARPPAFRRLAGQGNQTPREVDAAEPEREHLAQAYASVQGSDDHGPLRLEIIETSKAPERRKIVTELMMQMCGGTVGPIASGILSLTEKHDNLLMWAHYAGEHTGFVIEFDSSHEDWKRFQVEEPRGPDVMRKVRDSEHQPGRGGVVHRRVRTRNDVGSQQRAVTWATPTVSTGAATARCTVAHVMACCSLSTQPSRAGGTEHSSAD